MKNLSLIIAASLLSSSCAHSRYCNSIDLENKRKLQTCVLYDDSGNITGSTYTLFNGWNLPVTTVYDRNIDGPDEVIEYEYDKHRAVRSKTIRK